MILELLHRLRLNQRLATLFEQAGLKWSPTRTVHVSLALLLAGFTVTWRAAPDYRAFAIVPGLILGAIPTLYVMRKRRKRLRKFEELFPDSLEFLARSMRAGHAFSVALEMIHQEFQEPLAGEFRRAFDEQNLGLPLDVALEKLAERVPLDGRALLRLRGAAAKAHGRQPGGTAGQAGAPDPGALQAAGQASGRSARTGA